MQSRFQAVTSCQVVASYQAVISYLTVTSCQVVTSCLTRTSCQVVTTLSAMLPFTRYAILPSDKMSRVTEGAKKAPNVGRRPTAGDYKVVHPPYQADKRAEHQKSLSGTGVPQYNV